jgi:hypothetical protein
MKIHRAVAIRKSWCIRTDLNAQSTVYSVKGVYYKEYQSLCAVMCLHPLTASECCSPSRGAVWGPKSYDSTETLVPCSHFTVYRHNYAVANIAERSLRSCLQRKTTFYFAGSVRHWKQIPKIQQLRVVNKRPVTELCALLGIRILKANTCKRMARNL